MKGGKDRRSKMEIFYDETKTLRVIPEGGKFKVVSKKTGEVIGVFENLSQAEEILLLERRNLLRGIQSYR